MNFFTIDIEYIKYFHSFDSEVYFNENRHDYENKPYIGIVVSDEGIHYFIPLTSAKEKRIKLKNTGRDYIVIYEIINSYEIFSKDIIKVNSNGEIIKIIINSRFKKSYTSTRIMLL